MGTIAIGQTIRILRVPDGVLDTEGFPTRTMLTRCLGKVFPVMDLQGEFLGIDVGELNGKKSFMETIYIEPECVEIVS